MERITDDDLLNYLDHELDENSRNEIEHILLEDKNLSSRLNGLRSVHLLLSSQNKLESPSKNFTDKVMHRLHEKPTTFFLSPRNGLFLLSGILVASGITLALLSSGTFDPLHSLVNLSIPEKINFIKVPMALPFDLKIVLKIFLLLNLVIGFILLDRTILRPIFQKRLDQVA